VSSNYATAAKAGVNPALTFDANLLSAEVVFPVKDECVDYGSHRHLPDSI